MTRKRPSPVKYADHTFEPHKKKSHLDDDIAQITKETLLKALSDVEDEVGKQSLLSDSLRERLKDLRGQIKGVLENHEHEIERLHAEIDDLREEVKKLRAKNEHLEGHLDTAQATWLWEAQLARFVVHPSVKIDAFQRFTQMNRYLKKVRARDNLWIKLKRNIAGWTGKHWKMVNAVRRERNGIAHPSFIDLDLIEDKLEKIFCEFRKPMRDMLDILKTTASVMKFGRLAKFYKRNKNLFPHVRLSGTEKTILDNISSWDRGLEDIDGLQPFDHENAKNYLEKYVNDPRMIKHYFHVVDSIKDGNEKRMGNLAWEVEKRDHITKSMSNEEHEVVTTLKRLVPKTTWNVDVLPFDITMLHVPDFLPKHLWKHGIEIVEKCGFLKR